MKKAIILVVAVIALTVASEAQPKTRTQVAGVFKADRTYRQVTVNTCGVARCVQLLVTVPLGSQIVATRCYANITLDAGPDLPPDKFFEVPCGEDHSWSVFDPPVYQSTAHGVTVSTIFHNRSHNRDRYVKMEVEYIPPAGL